ncbi:MAG: hypothetical protein QOG58_4796 [Caballeronia sp.]|nr:hypothetical protein [Caballeronia sp.]
MRLVCACGYDDNSDDNQDDDSDVIERSDVCDGTWQRLRPDNILSDEMAAELSAKASCRVSPGRSQL